MDRNLRCNFHRNFYRDLRRNLYRNLYRSDVRNLYRYLFRSESCSLTRAAFLDPGHCQLAPRDPARAWLDFRGPRLILDPNGHACSLRPWAGMSTTIRAAPCPTATSSSRTR